MIRFALPVVISLLAIAIPARAQSLAHEKYTLDNGLTVILHEDRTLPVVSVNLWYRVGAKNEPPKRSGFAHLFEHLMFMGTKRVPGSDFDTLMEAGGGANNASTSLDRTNYYSWGPSSLLPTLLWLDADRMEDLGAMMDQSKLDLQRDVVRNELRQVVENTPYAKASEAVYQALYPVGHPYHFGVIGTHEDLEVATVSNVTDFFATFYVPSNCSLVVAGDFDAKQVKPLISSLFGTIPRGAEVAKVKIPQPALSGVTRETHYDQIQQPKVGFYYHSPATYAQGDAELMLLSMVLADGPSSRLYQRLVLEEQLAVDVRSFQEGATLGSVFGVEVTAKPEADLARIESIMDEELAKILAGELKDAELMPRKSVVELGLVSALQDLGRRADRLNEYEYFFGNPDSLKADIARFRDADAAKVSAWAKKVVTPEARLVQHVLPESARSTDGKQAAKAENKPEVPVDRPAIPAKGIGERPPSGRDVRPAEFASPAWTSPKPDEFRLTNGMRVLLYRRPSLPLVTMQALFVQPAPLDAPKEAGRSALFAKMLEEGTTRLSTGEFARAVQALGATFDAGVETNAIAVTLATLKQNLGPAADLWSEAIRSPRMAAEDWSRVQKNHIEELKQELEDPRATASRVGALALFGRDNPYAWSVDGSVATCAELSLEDVTTAYRSLIDPSVGVVIIAGDTTREEATLILERCFGSLKPKAAEARKARDFDFSVPKHPTRLIIVDRPNSTQTMVHFRAPGFAYGDPRRASLRALNTLLGGSFTSRLNANLREKNGYTYGARSSFTFAKELGSFQAGAAINGESTGAALQEFVNEFARFLIHEKGDATPAEVAKATRTLRTEAIQAFGTLSGTINAVGDLLQLEQPLDRIDNDLADLDKVSADAINAMAKESLLLDRGVIVLVGDKGKILEQIKDVKMPPPVFMDAEGNEIK